MPYSESLSRRTNPKNWRKSWFIRELGLGSNSLDPVFIRRCDFLKKNVCPSRLVDMFHNNNAQTTS